MKRFTILAYIATTTFILLSMSCNSRDEDAAEERAVQFAQNYFNLRFKQAASFCTKDSEKWIKYRAANIRQEDIDVVNAQSDTAVCNIEDVSGDDNSATVTISVNNFLRSDSIGKEGHMCKEAKYSVAMQKVGDTWLVHLEQPL